MVSGSSAAPRQQVANARAALHEALYQVSRQTGVFWMLRLYGARPQPWAAWRLVRDGVEPWWDD